MIPGQYILKDEDVVLNEHRSTNQLFVINIGDRPIQVGSHYHFFEVNRALEFDRTLARGMRLDIPSGNAVRFEPGERKSIQLVAFVGARQIHGFDNQINGLIEEHT